METLVANLNIEKRGCLLMRSSLYFGAKINSKNLKLKT